MSACVVSLPTNNSGSLPGLMVKVNKIWHSLVTAWRGTVARVGTAVTPLPRISCNGVASPLAIVGLTASLIFSSVPNAGLFGLDHVRIPDVNPNLAPST